MQKSYSFYECFPTLTLCVTFSNSYLKLYIIFFILFFILYILINGIILSCYIILYDSPIQIRVLDIHIYIYILRIVILFINVCFWCYEELSQLYTLLKVVYLNVWISCWIDCIHKFFLMFSLSASFSLISFVIYQTYTNVKIRWIFKKASILLDSKCFISSTSCSFPSVSLVTFPFSHSLSLSLSLSSTLYFHLSLTLSLS